MITSWNEWAEGTMIEPSVTYGNLYLDITREFAPQFKSGLPTPTPTNTPTNTPTRTATPTQTPTSTPTSTPTFTPTPTATSIATPAPSVSEVTSPLTPTLTIALVPQNGDANLPEGNVPATIIVSGTSTLRVRAAPNPDAEILGRLRDGITVTLLARTADSLWWQIAFPTLKQRGWISADCTDPASDTTVLPIRTFAPAITVTTTPKSMPTETPTPEPTATPLPFPPTPTPTLAPTPTPTTPWWQNFRPYIP
jgi:hypothetical protein